MLLHSNGILKAKPMIKTMGSLILRTMKIAAINHLLLVLNCPVVIMILT